jgi:hypothetical protein
LTGNCVSASAPTHIIPSARKRMERMTRPHIAVTAVRILFTDQYRGGV